MSNAVDMEYVKRLERRIHNQRIALRENWATIEMRAREGTILANMRQYRPLQSKWWDYVKELIREMKSLSDNAVDKEKLLRLLDDWIEANAEHQTDRTRAIHQKYGARSHLIAIKNKLKSGALDLKDNSDV